LEGPAYSPLEQAVYFTDMTGQRTIRYDEKTGNTTAIRGRGGNGLCISKKRESLEF
jgi:sugar lactone lactonase YvrE